MRSPYEILKFFFDAAWAARDATFFVQCKQRKKYLTKDVVIKWRIGKSPTLAQCKRFNLTEDELRHVGLLQSGRHGAYMIFRDCMLFPYIEGAFDGSEGRIVWCSSRRLVDYDPKTLEPIEASAKAMSMPAPNSKGVGGMERPTCFNMDLLFAAPTTNGVMIVEACLDAIASCEQGHPAIGMTGGSIRESLVHLIDSIPIDPLAKIKSKLYVALDGSKDVTEIKRAIESAKVGPETLVIKLPTNKDPDDQGDKDWLILKEQARKSLDCWLDFFLKKPSDWAADLTIDFKVVAQDWICRGLILEAELRRCLKEVLPLEESELDELLLDQKPVRKAVVIASGEGGRGKKSPPVDIAPLGPARVGFRPTLANYYVKMVWELPKSVYRRVLKEPEIGIQIARFHALTKIPLPKFEENNAQPSFFVDENDPVHHAPAGPEPGWDPDVIQYTARELNTLGEALEASQYPKHVAKDIGQIRKELLIALCGWPHRIRAVGAKCPLLFIDIGDGLLVQLSGSKNFQAFCRDYICFKFNPGQDYYRINYVGFEDLFLNLAFSTDVPEWISCEETPHEPRMEGLYYSYRPPVDYVPDGRFLAKFLSFFDNLRDPVSKALLAAAAVTPYWGGPYGKRPLFVFDAQQRGSGKSTAASLIARPSCRGGPLSINLDARAMERLKERMLSPEGRVKRVGMIDNVKNNVDDALLEELVTCEWISGKVLSVGEGSRPNIFTYYLTANAAILSSDLSSRSFYIHFQPLSGKGGNERADWERSVLAFTDRYKFQLIADALWLLRTKRKHFAWQSHKGERHPLWVEDVLVPILSSPVITNVIGNVTPLDVLKGNQIYRDECDDDLQEAQQFMDGLIERVIAWKSYDGISVTTKPIFIRTDSPPRKEDEEGLALTLNKHLYRYNMVAFWKAIFTRKDISMKWLVRRLNTHCEAGRLPGLSKGRGPGGIRGWHLDHAVVMKRLKKNSMTMEITQ